MTTAQLTFDDRPAAGGFEIVPDLEDVSRLTEHLRAHGWSSRAELATALRWTERRLRLVAEAAGAEVVRGQKGFNHVDNADPADLTTCANAFISQGNRMVALGLAWKRRAHGKIG